MKSVIMELLTNSIYTVVTGLNRHKPFSVPNHKYSPAKVILFTKLEGNPDCVVNFVKVSVL
jgi:hypothetical protein